MRLLLIILAAAIALMASWSCGEPEPPAPVFKRGAKVRMFNATDETYAFALNEYFNFQGVAAGTASPTNIIPTKPFTYTLTSENDSLSVDVEGDSMQLLTVAPYRTSSGEVKVHVIDSETHTADSGSTLIHYVSMVQDASVSVQEDGASENVEFGEFIARTYPTQGSTTVVFKVGDNQTRATVPFDDGRSYSVFVTQDPDTEELTAYVVTNNVELTPTAMGGSSPG